VTSDPTRLTVVGATDLERSLLQAARRERPSPELTARMAAGLGISAAAAVTAAAPVAAAKTMLTGWIPAGVIAVAVAAGVVGVRVATAPDRAARASKPAAAQITPRQEEAVIAVPVAVAGPQVSAVSDRRIEKNRKRAVVVPAGDLRDQIALIDAARTAVKTGLTERALVLLHRYEVSYPAGAFRPEALALRIEALGEGGRGAEAKALAREFLARYPQSPLADRVARAAR